MGEEIPLNKTKWWKIIQVSNLKIWDEESVDVLHTLQFFVNH